MESNFANKSRLLNALIKLQEDGPNNDEIGICNNIDCDDLALLFKSWSKFSGCIEYPVPSPHGRESPLDAYYGYDNIWEGAYGKLRKELLQHCINELEKELYD